MADTVNTHAHFSLLTWLPDPARGERKNLAVLLTTDDGRGDMRAVSPSAVGERLRDQGILPHLLSGLQAQFKSEVKPSADDLRRMRNVLVHSVQLTEPQPTAVIESVEATLKALFTAYVAPRGGGGSQAVTKGALQTRTVKALQKRGLAVAVNRYIGDFLFDVVVERAEKPLVVEVISFANARKDWSETEHEVGHFLYGLAHSRASGAAIINPPTEVSNAVADRAHGRVVRWLKEEHVRIFEPTVLRAPEPLLSLN